MNVTDDGCTAKLGQRCGEQGSDGDSAVRVNIGLYCYPEKRLLFLVVLSRLNMLI